MGGWEEEHSSSLYFDLCCVSVTPSQSEDNEVQYSEVRKGPRYVPKSRSESRSPPPGPMSPQARVPRSPGGVSELDSLLEMLNDTQINTQGEARPNS